MNNLFFDNYEELFNSENSLDKLWSLLLALATRGKLVEQNSDDEPASELLKKIEAEKENLVKEGKIRKQKKLPEIKEDEIPFAIPDSWEWVRLGEYIKVSYGGFLSKKNMIGGNIPVYGGNGINGYHNTYNVGVDTLVIGRVGYYCGSLHKTKMNAWVTDNAFITSFPKSLFFVDYLYWLLRGTDLQKNHSSTAQPVISGRKIYPILIAIPPLAEQQRIVERLDQLKQKIDHAKEKLKQRESARVKVSKYSLLGLRGSGDWQFISENFAEFIKTKDDIANLKNAILDLAIKGKLVPQDPKDEPASELLKKIEAEKEKSIKEGKIKKQKKLPEIEDDEIPFEVPNSWEWVRLGEVTTYGFKQTIKYEDLGRNMWILELADIEKITSRIIEKNYSEDKIFKSTKNVFSKGDVLYGKLRPALDKVVVADEGGICTTEIVPFNGNGLVNSFYLRYVLKSKLHLTYAINATHGMDMPRLGTPAARNSIVSLPPLAEQQRIVERLDELFALIDQLKEKVSSTEEKSEMLVDSILDRAFG